MKLSSFILPVFILLILSGCLQQSTIQIDHDSVILKMDEKKYIALHIRKIKERNRFFRGLHLKQQILQSHKGMLLVLETVNLDNYYEFHQTLKRTIEVVFETRHINKILSSGTLYTYQLILSDGRVLNLVAQKEGIFTMKLLYGMDSVTFTRILKQFSSPIPKIYTTPIYTTHHIEKAIVSKWDIIKVQFHPLVGRMPHFNTIF